MDDPNLNELPTEPRSLKDRLIGLVLAIAFIGLCAGIWLAPDLIGMDSAEYTGRTARKVAFFVNLLWSRPVGTIAGILGLLMVWGSFSKEKVAD